MLSRKLSVISAEFFAARLIMAVTVLTPPRSDVLENSSVTLACRWNGTEEKQDSQWRIVRNTSFVGYIYFDENDTCSATGTLSSPNSYAWSCTKPSSFSLTLKSVKREEHMEEWYCFMSFMQSNPSKILVQVPVESVEMISHPDQRIAIKENTSESFECKTSSCRPTSIISWFLVSPDQRRDINITHLGKQSSTAESSDDFTEVTSVIIYRFNRTLNNWIIYCQAANIPGKNVTSSIKKLDILYPPDDDLKVTDIQDGDKYRVVENQLGQLSCVATGGNPLASLTWFCFSGNSVSKVTGNETVTSTVTWTALRIQDDKLCTCEADHSFGSANVSVNVEILYPPDRPLFKMEDEYLVDFIEIIQNNSKTVMCTSDSNPAPDYTWKRPSEKSEETAQQLNISSAQAKDEGEYKCSVNNIMIASDGSVVSGSNSSVISVNILYPPMLPRLIYIDNTTSSPITGKFMDVVHGDIFKILCESVGHPVPTYQWENTDVGNVSTVIAGQSVNKTCTAKNKMTETVGESRIGKESATVFVNVLYPPVISNIYAYNSSRNKLKVLKELNVIERESFNLLCESDGRPSPEYKWNMNDNATVWNQIIEKRNISRNESGNYTCNAFNTMNRTFGNRSVGSSHRSILVDVLYPPQRVKFSYIDNTTSISITANSVDVIQGDNFKILCETIGNPNPSYEWENADIGNMSYITAGQSVNKTCTATNIMTETLGGSRIGSLVATVLVSVLYPPIKPFFRINSTSVFGVLHLIQNNTLHVSCESRSNPMPMYTWNGPNVSNKKEQTLGITAMDINNEGQYICTAANRMVRSDNTYRDGSKTSAINIKMLYPPRKFNFRYGNKDGELIKENTMNVVKGDSFSIYCDADGYPRPVFKWDNNTYGHSLNITAITSDVKKTCTATNWMNETLGESRLGLNSATVSISVLYKASVLHFYIGQESTVKSSFTVNETELVTFSCKFDSNPPPIATLSHLGRILDVSVSNNSLVYTKKNIQCKDFGMYICSARNKYNYGTPSAKNLTMYVNCSPRPSPFFELIENVNSPIYTSATLRFSALAFPEPGPSGFTWYYLNGPERIMLTDSHTAAISSSSSQSSLTIINVTQSDYGQYILRIANSIGDYEQKFSLEPHSPTTVSNYVASSSNTVAFVAVGVGTSVATLVLGGSILFAYRFIRRRRKQLHNVHNVFRRHAETTKDNNDVAVYEQISMRSADTRPSSSSDNRESLPVNESAQQYEKLDENRKERDQYSQLPALNEQIVIPREQTEDESAGSSETQHNIKDYVNIRI